MASTTFQTLASGVQRVLGLLRRPELMVFLPGATLAAFWLGGERALVLVALATPMLFALAGAFRSSGFLGGNAPASGKGAVTARLDEVLKASRDSGKTTAAFVIRMDAPDQALVRQGLGAQAEVLARCHDRILGVLREGDFVTRLEGTSFAVVLGPVRRLDLETCIQLAARMQSTIAEPISVDAMRLHVSASIGFCLAQRAPKAHGAAIFDSADIAAFEAERHGPSAIRAWDASMTRRRADRETLSDELDQGLTDGQIRAHFQPQLSTDTGEISGFEALARWYHPKRGLIAPAEFLPLVEQSGFSERLGEAMLYQALSALAVWDKAGLNIPSVSINLSRAELRSPGLADKLKWELDRFEISPKRLTIEILESVAGETENDVIISNIAAISKLGCGVDLDDFGTGNGSILSLRRFAIRRVKIDRGFVTRVDEDRDQQRVVSAILSMAERLGLETVGEGVETPGEHAMLGQLGCTHVQGFGIARPMTLDDTLTWIARHRARPNPAPRIGTQAS